MGYTIPVFYLPMAQADVPVPLTSWIQLSDVLNSAFLNPASSGLRSTSSKSWWHQGVLEGLCQYYSITGLEFISAEADCLTAERLAEAQVALEVMLNRLRDISYRPTQWDEGLRSIWWIWYEEIDRRWEQRSAGDMRRVFNESRPEIELRSEDESGLRPVIDFVSFLKTFLAAINGALAKGVCLVFLRPQP